MSAAGDEVEWESSESECYMCEGRLESGEEDLEQEEETEVRVSHVGVAWVGYHVWVFGLDVTCGCGLGRMLHVGVVWIGCQLWVWFI